MVWAAMMPFPVERISASYYHTRYYLATVYPLSRSRAPVINRRMHGKLTTNYPLTGKPNNDG